MNLGTTIKTLRKRKRLGQKTLAAACGVTHTYLSQVENNRKRPSPDLMDALARELEVPVPILYFLSMDDQDVDPNKAQAFEVLKKPIDAMIEAFFIETQS